MNIINVKIINYHQALSTPDVQHPTETVIADVIKNISRVNNILQELIHNYEHLQKIYKSQENLEGTTDYPLFRDNIKIKKVNKSIHGDQFPATEMVWSDMDEEETNEITLNVNGIPETTLPTIKAVRQNFKPTTKKSRTDSEMLILLSSSESTIQPNTSKQMKFEVKFIDTHKKRVKSDEKERKKMVVPDIMKDTDKKKTRFSIEPSRHSFKSQEREKAVVRLTSANETPRVRKRHRNGSSKTAVRSKRLKTTTRTSPLVIKLSLGNNMKSNEVKVASSRKKKRGDNSLIILRSHLYRGNSDLEPKNTSLALTKKSFSAVSKNGEIANVSSFLI